MYAEVLKKVLCFSKNSIPVWEKEVVSKKLCKLRLVCIVQIIEFYLKNLVASTSVLKLKVIVPIPCEVIGPDF